MNTLEAIQKIFGTGEVSEKWLEKQFQFAALIRNLEREACAKLCDEMARLYDLSIDPVEELIACETSAAIRARWNT